MQEGTVLVPSSGSDLCSADMHTALYVCTAIHVTTQPGR
jgi:hypothetical protein